MLKNKCDINQQDLKRVTLHFAKSESFSLTWSCGSRQRDTASSGWKFELNNLAVGGYFLHKSFKSKFFSIWNHHKCLKLFPLHLNAKCYGSTTITNNPVRGSTLDVRFCGLKSYLNRILTASILTVGILTAPDCDSIWIIYKLHMTDVHI